MIDGRGDSRLAYLVAGIGGHRVMLQSQNSPMKLDPLPQAHSGGGCGAWWVAR